MDFAHWVGYTASALSGAAVALAGAWFWIRRAQLKIRGEESEQEAKENATVTKAWRELMEYKSDDFRKKNQEQDARVAAMIVKMDEMHAAHLKCERDAAEREVTFMREAVTKEIQLKKHEARIAELTEQISVLRFDMESLRAHQKAVQ